MTKCICVGKKKIHCFWNNRERQMHALFHKIQQNGKTHRFFAIGSPALVWQLIFFYLPLILTISSSCWRCSDTGTFQGWTMQYLGSLFSKMHLNVIAYSLILATVTALLCLLIAFPLAHFIAFRSGRHQTTLLFFLIVPFWTNFLLHVYAWFFALEQTGFLNNLLLALGLTQTPIHFLNSPFSVLLMMVYCFLPFMVLPIFSSLEKFDKELLEASNDLGASLRQTFIKIVLPLTLPGVRTGFFLVFVPAFGEFIIPELMGGDKQYFVGSVVSQYILGSETQELGAAFMALSCLFLAGAACVIHCVFRQISTYLTRTVR